MSSTTTPPKRRPRVLCHVQFLTWVPSSANRINTTDKHVIGLDAWVDTPDDNTTPARAFQYLGEQAIAIVKAKAAAGGIDFLGLVGLTVSEQMDTTIANQPAPRLDDMIASDTGLKLV